MSETTMHESNSIDDEKPSSIKEGFTRWLVVVLLLFTIVFVYLYISMSNDEEAEAAAKKKIEKVPEQVQEGLNDNEIAAVEKFKKNINSKRIKPKKIGDKLETDSINSTFAPRRTIEPSSDNGTTLLNKVKSKKLMEESSKESPYQKYIKEEQARAYKSIASKDTIGSSKGFYNDSSNSKRKSNKRSKSKSKAKSLKMKQGELQSQIKLLEQYRKGIESGAIDPSKTPPPGNANLKPFKPRGKVL